MEEIRWAQTKIEEYIEQVVLFGLQKSNFCISRTVIAVLFVVWCGLVMVVVVVHFNLCFIN